MTKFSAQNEESVLIAGGADKVARELFAGLLKKYLDMVRKLTAQGRSTGAGGREKYRHHCVTYRS